MKPIKLISYCPKEKRGCVRWVEKYFKDCLCNLNDDISFGLGLVSLVSWGVAEIPQIITNFGNKSGSGVSLAFLSTWIVGDIFNLVGCVLEPATLPTQFYTALVNSCLRLSISINLKSWLYCKTTLTNSEIMMYAMQLRSTKLCYLLSLTAAIHYNHCDTSVAMHIL